jgi:hypothetical protein
MLAKQFRADKRLPNTEKRPWRIAVIELGRAEVIAPRQSVVEGSAPSQESGKSSFAEIFDSFSEEWGQSQSARSDLLQAVPEQYRQYLSVQSTFQELGLKSQLLAKVGESASSMVRRLQQLGGA